MSIVYQARDNNTGQMVALKLLLPEHANNESVYQRFALEARASYGMQHRNIAATIDFNLSPENGIPAYLVMKWLPGQSLEERIKNGHYQSLNTKALLQEADEILQKIADALDYIHYEHKIVHRDIKPSNIIIYNGEPYLVDFGMAKRLIEEGDTLVEGDGLTQAATIAPGTPRYIAPETVQFLPIDGRTDQYSMALVLYEMLTGTGVSPYTRTTGTNTQWQEMHLTQSPKPLTEVCADIPPVVWDVVRKALSKKTTQRYESMREFSRAFSRATTGRKIGISNKSGFIAVAAVIVTLLSILLFAALAAKEPSNAAVASISTLPSTQSIIVTITQPFDSAPTLTDDEKIQTALAVTEAIEHSTQSFETQVAAARFLTEQAITPSLTATPTETVGPTYTQMPLSTPTNTTAPTFIATSPPTKEVVVQSTARPASPQTFNCSGAYFTDLQIGERFTVPFGDGPTSVYSRVNGGRLGYVGEGVGGVIKGKPICDRGLEGNLVWYLVETDNGYTGYMAEGYSHDSVAWIARETVENIRSAPTVAPSGNTTSSLPHCPGAPPIYIKIGQKVVVDFSDKRSASRIMNNGMCGSDCTVAQTYDSEILEVIDGPRCHKKDGQNVWYWYIYHPGLDVYGWVLEGVAGDRWLCDLTDPDCGS